MDSKIVKYVIGEDREACECFEPLWQRVLREYKPTKPLALMLPCTWGKPYRESYLTQYILGGLLASCDKLLEGEKFKEAREYLDSYEHKDVLDVVDVWHMSSCGFVPEEMERTFDPETGYAFFAYDWDSERATEEDIEGWFVAARRRAPEWVNTYRSLYEKTFVYLREGSKSREVMTPYYEDKGRVVDSYLSGPQDFPTVVRWLSLNGRREEVDLPLITSFSISFLAFQVVEAVMSLAKSSE